MPVSVQQKGASNGSYSSSFSSIEDDLPPPVVTPAFPGGDEEGVDQNNKKPLTAAAAVKPHDIETYSSSFSDLEDDVVDVAVGNVVVNDTENIPVTVDDDIEPTEDEDEDATNSQNNKNTRTLVAGGGSGSANVLPPRPAPSHNRPISARPTSATRGVQQLSVKSPPAAVSNNPTGAEYDDDDDFEVYDDDDSENEDLNVDDNPTNSSLKKADILEDDFDRMEREYFEKKEQQRLMGSSTSRPPLGGSGSEEVAAPQALQLQRPPSASASSRPGSAARPQSARGRPLSASPSRNAMSPRPSYVALGPQSINNEHGDNTPLTDNVVPPEIIPVLSDEVVVEVVSPTPFLEPADTELSPPTTEHSTLEPLPVPPATTAQSIHHVVVPPTFAGTVNGDVADARGSSGGSVSSSTPSVASSSRFSATSRTDEALASFKDMIAQSSNILPAPPTFATSSMEGPVVPITPEDAASSPLPSSSSSLVTSHNSSPAASPLAGEDVRDCGDEIGNEIDSQKKESPAPLNLDDLTSTTPVQDHQVVSHTADTKIISRPGSASSIATTAPITRPQSAFHSSSTAPKASKATAAKSTDKSNRNDTRTGAALTTSKSNIGSTRPSTAKHSRVTKHGVGPKATTSTSAAHTPSQQTQDISTTKKKSPPLSPERRPSSPNVGLSTPPANVVSAASFLARSFSTESFSHNKRESNTSVSNKSLGEVLAASGSIKPRVPRLSKRAQLDAKIKKERAESAELLKPILAASFNTGGEPDCGSNMGGGGKSKRKSSTPSAPLTAEERRAHVLAAYDDRLVAVAVRAANINQVQAEKFILDGRNTTLLHHQESITDTTAAFPSTAAHFEQFKADAQLAYRYKELLSELRLDNDTTTYSNLGISSTTENSAQNSEDPSPKELLCICNTFLASKRVFDEHQVKTERKVQVAVEKARQEDLATKKKNKDARRKAIEDKRAALLATVGIAGAQQRLKDHAPSPSRLGGGGSMSPEPHYPSTRNGSFGGFDLGSSFNINTTSTTPKATRLSLTNNLFEAQHSSLSDVGSVSDDDGSDKFVSRASSPTNHSSTRPRHGVDKRHVPPVLPSNSVRTRLALESSSLLQLKKSTCSVVDAILQREATLENIRRLSEDYTEYPKNYNATMAESLVSEQIDIIRSASERVVGCIHEWRELMHSYEETRGIVGQWRDKAIKLQEMREREAIQENQRAMNSSESCHQIHDASRRESGAGGTSSQAMSHSSTASPSRRGSLQSKRVTSPSDPVAGLSPPSSEVGGGGDLPPVNPNSRPFPFMHHSSYIHKMQKDLTFLYATALGPFILIDVHNNVLLANRPRRVIAEEGPKHQEQSSRSRHQSTSDAFTGDVDVRPSFGDATHNKPRTLSIEHHHKMLQGGNNPAAAKGKSNLVSTSIPTHQLLQAMFIGSTTKSYRKHSSPVKVGEDGADLVVDSTALTGHDVRPMSPSQLRDEYFFARMSAPKDTLAVRRAAGHRRAELDEVTQKMIMASSKRGKQQSPEDARDEIVYANLDSMRLSAEVERSQNIWFRGATSKVIPVLKKRKHGEDQRPTGAKAYSPTRSTSSAAPTSSFKTPITPLTSISNSAPTTMGRGGAVQLGGGGTILQPLQQQGSSGAPGRSHSSLSSKMGNSGGGGATIQQAALNALGATTASHRKYGLDTASMSSIMLSNNNTSAWDHNNDSKNATARPVSALRARLDAIHQMSRVKRLGSANTLNTSAASQQPQIDRRSRLIYARPMDRYCTVVDARRADQFNRVMSDPHHSHFGSEESDVSSEDSEARNNAARSAGPGKRIPTPSGGRVGTPVADIGRQGDEARAERRRAANGGVTPRAISSNPANGHVSLTLSNGYSSLTRDSQTIPGLVKKTLGDKKRKSMTHTSLMRNLKKLSGNHRRWWDLCFTIVLCTFWAKRMRRRVVDARACRKIQRWFRSILHREQFIQLTEKAFIEKFRPRVEHTVMWWPVEVRTLEDVDQMEDDEDEVTEWRAAMTLVLEADDRQQSDGGNGNGDDVEGVRDPLTPIVRVRGVPVLTQLCTDPYQADELLFEEPVNIEMGEEDNEQQQLAVPMGELSPSVVLQNQQEDLNETGHGSGGANSSLLMFTSTLASEQCVRDATSIILSPRSASTSRQRRAGGGNGSMNMQVATACLRTVDSFRSPSLQQDSIFSSSVVLMSESNLPGASGILQKTTPAAIGGSLRLLPPRPLSPIGARQANNTNITTPTHEAQIMAGSVSPLIRLTTPTTRNMLQNHSSNYYDDSTPTPTQGGSALANLQVVTTAGGRNVYLVPATMDGGLGHDGTRSFRLPDESISGSDCEEELGFGSVSGASASGPKGGSSRGTGRMDASIMAASTSRNIPMPYIKRLPTVLLGDDFRENTGMVYTDPIEDLPTYKQCPPTNADGTLLRTTTSPSTFGTLNSKLPPGNHHNTSPSSAAAFTNFNSEETHRITVLRLARALRQSEMFGRAKLLGCTLPTHKGNLYIYDLLKSIMEKQRVYEYEEMTAQQRTNLRRKNYEVASGRATLPKIPVHCTIVKKKLMFKEDAREFRQNQRIAEIRAKLIEEFNAAKQEAIQGKTTRDQLRLSNINGAVPVSVSFIDEDDSTGLVRDTFAADTNNDNDENVEDLELDEELLNEEANRIFGEEMLEAQTQMETERLYHDSMSLISSASGGARSTSNLPLNPWSGMGNTNIGIARSRGSAQSGVAMGIVDCMSLSSSDRSENNLQVEEVITTSQRTTYFPFRAPKGTPSRPYRSSIISVFHYLTECASAIQRTWRRSVNRAKMPFFTRRCKATVKLQRFWRHHVHAVRLRAQIGLRVAATKIRRISYYFICRRQLIASCTKTRNATIIRRAYLTACSRATLKRHRLERASATTIQRNFRGFLGRERARKTRHCQTILRFVAIRCITRPHVITTMINKNAAERIQRCTRCMIARTTFKNAKLLADEKLWLRLQIDRDTVYRKAIATIMAVYKGFSYRRAVREEYELLHYQPPSNYAEESEMTMAGMSSKGISPQHHQTASMNYGDDDGTILPPSWLTPSNCDLRSKSCSYSRWQGGQHPGRGVIPYATHRYLPEYEDNQELLLIALSEEYGSRNTSSTGDRHFADRKVLNFVQRVWREAVLLPSVVKNRSTANGVLESSSSALRIVSAASHNPPAVVLQCFFRKLHASRRLIQLREEKEIRRTYLATWQVGARWLRVYRRECAVKASIMWMHILRRHHAKRAVSALKKHRKAADQHERRLEASTMLVSLWRGYNQRRGGGGVVVICDGDASSSSTLRTLRHDPATAARQRILRELEAQRMDDAARTLQDSLRAFHGHQRFRRTVHVKRRTAATKIQHWWKERLLERVTCEVRYEYAKEATKAAIVLQLFFKAVVGAARARRKRESRLEEIRNRRFFK